MRKDQILAEKVLTTVHEDLDKQDLCYGCKKAMSEYLQAKIIKLARLTASDTADGLGL